MGASSPPSGSLQGCLGLSHSTWCKEQLWKAPFQPHLLLGPHHGVCLAPGAQGQCRGTNSGDPLPEALMRSAFSCHMDPKYTPPSLLPPVPSYTPSRPGGQVPTFPFHQFPASSPQVHGQKGGLPVQGGTSGLGPQSLLERGCGSLQVPTGVPALKALGPFPGRLRGEGAPSPAQEQACCTRGESLNAVPWAVTRPHLPRCVL